MKITIINKKQEEEQVEVKFTSIWWTWILSYLATAGVILGTIIILAILVGMTEIIVGV